MDVYERLANHLDRLPGGFVRTDSGVEMRILRRLFSPEEAELAQHLSLVAAAAPAIAHRADIPVSAAEARLETMALKGLIYSFHPQDGPPLYVASHFVVGIYEFQVERLDAELARDATDYLEQLPPENWQRAPQMRTIPIGESISYQQQVMPYEQAEALLQEHKTFRVSPCICRRNESLLGKGCDKPLETCLSFDAGADYYARLGIGRAINREEALAILRQANTDGLVLQPDNTQHPGFICCCCGDCCGVLKIAKRHPRPASVLVSPFYAAVNSETCSACGDCELRCQMEAIAVDNGYALVDLDRCIGCGLCITTCPEEAVTLVRKPAAAQPPVPRNGTELYMQMLRARGLIRRPAP